jgi:exodeoxyribonuclease-3
VNSLKVRPQVLQWLETNPVDVLCIQETKLTDDKFPQAEIEAAGYHVAYTGQKTYNGGDFIQTSYVGYTEKQSSV